MVETTAQIVATPTIAEVLATKPILDIAALTFFRAKKTKPLCAKPMAQILVDPSVQEKFLLQTLEGNQMIRAGSILCVGGGNDAWQQTQKNLFKKYDVVSIDDNGWMTCVPKPENEVLAAKVSVASPGFSIRGEWGTGYVLDNQQVFLQHGVSGDFVCRRPDDNNDIWIVQGRLFLATYAALPV